jgi:hypothetical protein
VTQPVEIRANGRRPGDWSRRRLGPAIPDVKSLSDHLLGTASRTALRMNKSRAVPVWQTVDMRCDPNLFGIEKELPMLACSTSPSNHSHWPGTAGRGTAARSQNTKLTPAMGVTCCSNPESVAPGAGAICCLGNCVT